MQQAILTEVDAGVGIITLNCPERHNAFDDVLISELTQAIDAMTQDAAVRVIVLSGSGKSFCAGADLNWMRRAANYSDAENLRDARALAEMLRCLAQCPKPTIARVQGPAYAGGVGLVACCDIVIAVFDAQFSLPEVRIGIVPATISPYVISAIGERHARRYMLTAERFSAAVAYRMGLVHELVADVTALDKAVGEVVEDLLKNAPGALAECKSLITAVAAKPVTSDLIEDTAQRIMKLRASTEGREGIRAFLEKRKPNWAANEKL
ncbi:MAG: enoyl-CoA hydratase/isomerase family protein [Rugosibacter sp.]|nr:enoyl-CoA hydratase/isomerase family protein [Rugosibacter sp.]